MKKLLIVLGIVILGVTLTACGEDTITVTPPEIISFKINETEPVSNGELVPFYLGKDESVEVDIAIDNPSNVEITSVVINGYNHRISKYKEGSTTRRIIFDLDVGDTTGEITFSIDEIKYTNDENTEKVILELDKYSFKVYVYKDEPTVNREDYSVGQDYISVDFLLTDIDEVIRNNTFIAQIFSGDTNVDSFVVDTNSSNILFEGLFSQSTYEVRLIADYDLDDTEGLLENVVLYTSQFTTLPRTIPSALISNVSVNQDTVTFDVSYSDADGIIVENGKYVRLLEEGQVIAVKQVEEGVSTMSFGPDDFEEGEGLKNNHSYDLVFVAEYDLFDGSNENTITELNAKGFTTPTNSPPGAEIVDLSIEENLVNFGVNIIDPFNLISYDQPEYLMAQITVDDIVRGVSPVINNKVEFQIFNLFSSEDFQIEIFAKYDLNDGEGEVNENILDETYTTNYNDPPLVTVSNLELRQGYVTLNLSVEDNFSTLKGDLTATLFEDGVPVGNPILFNDKETMIEFEHLVKNTSVYSVEIRADYNLRDESGNQTDQLLYSKVVVSVEKKDPVAEILNPVVDNGSISFNVRVMDADNTILGNPVVVYLLKDNVVDPLYPVGILVVGESPLVTFTGLKSDSEYSVVVRTTYDLDEVDGPQVDQKIAEEVFTTLPKVLPTAVLENFVTENDQLTVDITILDPDGVVDLNSIVAELYRDGVHLADKDVSLTGLISPNVLFDELLSNYSYSVKVKVNYDLNDGEDPVENYYITQGNTNTQFKQEPEATIDIVDTGKQSITLDVNISDPDFVIIEDPNLNVTLRIYHGNLEDIIIYDITQRDLTNGIEITVPQSDTRYIIEVIATYFLNDGGSNVTKVLSYDDAYTLKNELPYLEFVNSSLGKDTFEFEVDVFDPDVVINPGTLLAVLYKDGGLDGAHTPIPLSVGNNVEEFTNLESDSFYTVKIVAEYNLRDGGDANIPIELDVFSSTTEKLEAPTMAIVIVEERNTEIDFKVTITDEDDTLDQLFAYIIDENGDQVGLTIDLSSDLGATYTFTGLEFGANYTIKLEAIINFKDGLPFVSINPIASLEASTLELFAVLNLEEVKRYDDIDIAYDPSQLFVTFDLEAVDSFDILDSVPHVINLYLDNGDGTFTFVNQVSFVGEETSIEFSNLFFDRNYYFEVVTSYTVDGDSFTDETVFTYEFTTNEIAELEIEITNLVITDANVVFDIDGLEDDDSLVTGNFVVELWIDGVHSIAEDQVIAVGDNSFTFTNTPGIHTYQIIVRSDVDYRDGNGPITGYIHHSLLIIDQQ